MLSGEWMWQDERQSDRVRMPLAEDRSSYRVNFEPANGQESSGRAKSPVPFLRRKSPPSFSRYASFASTSAGPFPSPQRPSLKAIRIDS